MSLDVRLTLTLIFFLFLIAFILTHKKGRQIHVWKAVPIFYAVMYRTKFGLMWMNKVGRKYKRFLKYAGYVAIAVGFVGMILITFFLVKGVIPLIFEPDAPVGAGLVLPVKGSGVFEDVVFFVPIEFWIISIFIIALVHEYAHGVLSRTYDIKVKSSGFAFLGIIVPIIPAAFVEPEEKILKKRPVRQQLSVFAAGPMANIVLAVLCGLILVFALTPLSSKMIEANGVTITNFVEGDFPAKNAGMKVNEVIKEINGIKTPYLDNLSYELARVNPGNPIRLTTDKGTYKIKTVKNPENSSKAYLGIYLAQSSEIKSGVIDKYGSFFPNALIWLIQLFLFLFILNLGIGLFNLLPMGPLDGGRMLHITLLKYFKKEKAMKIFTNVSIFLLFVVLLTIFVPIIKNIISNIA
ncbi:MAG: site-2 protease family protein [Candidatus Woesearchaeota archaeon]|jgi:membrane-associated protease RseP (regulator of RpoE activity)|nr:site-2 protease family protein [Candidatus Woesearchaeota archaeon]MDP7622739.1 site-2 protease family protein [Candidatus Woesearchaeota archaeon]HJN57080.1 site-2 protease family protein [Candidatus Woesearchaeota archaeon]|tara:strand:+ start:13681 stop:14904 length:1224 start_codon:yes stop_codon:yes gene_type:complete